MYRAKINKKRGHDFEEEYYLGRAGERKGCNYIILNKIIFKKEYQRTLKKVGLIVPLNWTLVQLLLWSVWKYITN